MKNKVRERILDIVMGIVIIITIIALGIVIINQFFSWYYRAYFLLYPCELCVKLNPEYAGCFITRSIIN